MTARSGRSVLARLVALGADEFATEYWGRQAKLSRATELPTPFADLLGPDAVDELISERGLRTPFLRVAKDGSTLPEKSFTAGGGVGASVVDQISEDKLLGLFADGATLVLQALHRTWPPIIAFCQQLAADLGHPVQANAYVTPPQSQGFSHHFDIHDVFVLQIQGEKRWTVHEPVHQAPLRDQPWTNYASPVRSRAAQQPLIEATLTPGDCLYLPRGFLHAAQALGGVSTHLTVGVHTWTRYGLAEELITQVLQQLAADPQMRSSLPLGASFDDEATVGPDLALVREAIAGALGRVGDDQIMVAMQTKHRAAQRAGPLGPLRQLRDAGALNSTTRVALRRHLCASIEQSADHRILVRSRAGVLEVAEDATPVVKQLLTEGSVLVGDLGQDLCRRMLLGGLVVVE